MQKVVIFLMLAALPMFAFAEQCAFTENQLLGKWLASSDTEFFGEMELRLEGNHRIFNSWLDHRPEFINGTWVFKNCKLKISHQSEQALSFDFAVQLKNRDNLELKENDEPAVKYHRIKPKNAP